MLQDSLIEFLESNLRGRDSAIVRDLKLNLIGMVTQGGLEESESLMALLVSAKTVGWVSLQGLARELLSLRGVAVEHVLEAEECAAMMGLLNTYYRFRHMLSESLGEEAVFPYQRAGLRMNAMARPVLGKERYEMLSFTASVLNGCQMCVVSHEKALRELGVGTEKIHSLARLASVVKGLHLLLSP